MPWLLRDPGKNLNVDQIKRQSYKIKDVPLSKHMSEGSRASLGSINYHYQKYYNTFAFLKDILKSDPSLSKMVCIPDVGEGWMQSFLKVHFFKSTKAGVFFRFSKTCGSDGQ